MSTLYAASIRKTVQKNMRTSTDMNTYRYYPEYREVRLAPGTPFYDRQNEMREFLLAQDPGSMLYNFRKASGLSTMGAEPMTGWDADDCKLKGHTTGHYMSALALCYAATGNEKARDILSYIVSGLAECQEAFAKTGRTAPGFLSGYDEEQFDLLEEYTKYPDIWAPYYTLDKIMAGLIDAYELAGIEQALEILDPLGDWVYARLGRLGDEQRSRMWSMYIAGEYGGMIGTMVRLHRITGKADHLAAARLFENDNLFGQMADGRDELDTMHANQHIPQIMGAAELYLETGDRRYRDIAKNFHRIVTQHHCYAIGGTGEEERFHAADTECGYLTEKAAESCASCNMLRLTSQLFAIADSVPDDACCSYPASLMDYYENTLFNHIMMSSSHEHDGGTTYFMPLAPGSTKYYEREENSCCHGTGMESRFRYMTQIYSFEEDNAGKLLRVNLPVPSSLKGQEHVTVEFSDEGMLTVRADADMKSRLAVRIPDWAGDEPHVTIKAADGMASDGPMHMEGRYLYIDRVLQEGEAVSIELPMNIIRNTSDSDPGYCTLKWGPYMLAAVSDSLGFIEAPDPGMLTPLQGEGGTVFTDGRLTYLPLYMVDHEHYHIYFRADCDTITMYD